jgi:L-fuconolactonase
MVTVDAHQHFWDPEAARYPWMHLAPPVLQRRFMPGDLEPLLAAGGISRTVLVQARSDLAETRDFLRIAADSPFVAGVVGWVDLTDPGVDDVIAELRDGPNGGALVGIRHQVEDEPDPDWLLRTDVQRGLAAVQGHDLVYDLLVRPPQLPAAIKTVQEQPGTRFVVDHLAKPLVRTGELEPWAGLMTELAMLPNVACKLSGMVAEADPAAWSPQQFVPYVDHVINAFGIDRVMFGSDWPVCLVTASYEETLAATHESLPALTEGERARVFGDNAVSLYRLDVAS